MSSAVWVGVPDSKGEREGILSMTDPEDKLRGPPDSFMQERQDQICTLGRKENYFCS